MSTKTSVYSEAVEQIVAKLVPSEGVDPVPIAKCFEDIGQSLHRGDDPMQVAAVCFAAAAALRSPEDADEIYNAVAKTVASMESSA